MERRNWVVGQRLNADRGGFGDVFEAMADDGRPVVVKRVRKEPGAERELLFGDAIAAAEFRNVMPILDHGEDGDDWVLVMPRAEKSLAQEIQALDGTLMDRRLVLRVLSDIATALVEIEGHIVHRDIKPQNVLYLDGAWCLADFGISRYAEATTAPDTRKFSWTPPYAAPEQWNAERPTSATDIYAFGVMAYELLAGQRPFAGPDVSDFREQHLTQVPPPLVAGTGRLRTIVEECLYKDPAARPTPSNLLARLGKAEQEPRGPGASRLAAASHRQAVERTKAHADAQLARQQSERLARIAADGERAFEVFADAMLEMLEDDAPTASLERRAGRGAMVFVGHLGKAKLGLSRPQPAPAWSGPFTVAAYASISIAYDNVNHWGWQGRSHSLWYCDAFEEGRFAWYETAFMDFALSGTRPSIEPYALEPPRASDAFSNVIGTVQLAWPVEELDRDEPDVFVDRWLGWYADAVEGKLDRPSTMPERRDERKWRRA
ncbi:serine/threonine-protein kinase [Georgenia sp. H159]|uniref:serine/threonine-protein kinase n=1 Tax=Georgenia sp. H159 TaxID=3076115 RepID=UPI002D77C69E|nr:serine/threonine-protein kinase [Georgenia sp. H159]